MFEPLAETDDLIRDEADAPIKLDHGLVARAHLQIDFRAAELAQQPLGLRHDLPPVTAATILRIHREIVDPAAMPLVAHHHRRDQLAANDAHEKPIWLAA